MPILEIRKVNYVMLLYSLQMAQLDNTMGPQHRPQKFNFDNNITENEYLHVFLRVCLGKTSVMALLKGHFPPQSKQLYHKQHCKLFSFLRIQLILQFDTKYVVFCSFQDQVCFNIFQRAAGKTRGSTKTVVNSCDGTNLSLPERKESNFR